MRNVDWETVLLAITVIAGILLGPYDVLLILQRRWMQRQRDRIERGEDVRPKKLPADEFWE